jgi:hypothetical protein
MRRTLLILSLVAGVYARPAGAQCYGDCNGDGNVTINELVLLVNIALGNAPKDACSGFEPCEGICIGPLITAVNSLLIGCPPLLPPLLSSTPSIGAGSVARTAWLKLDFAESVDLADLARVRLTCSSPPAPSGGGLNTIDVAASQLSPTSVVLNPSSDLPAGSDCVLRLDADSSIGFSVAAAGAPVTLLYDRGDPTRTSPFPDDYWTVEDDSMPTGLRVNVPVPAGAQDAQDVFGGLVPEANKLDGFSPISWIVVEVSDPPDPTTVPRTAAESLDPLATVLLIDMTPGSPSFGQRVPIRVQPRTDTSFGGLVSHSLLIFPSVPLQQRHRYGLVITRRVLVDPSRPLDPSPDFVADSRAAALAFQVFEALPASGLTILPDDVALALRITVRSLDSIADDFLAIKQQVLAAPPPGYSITSVVPQSGTVAAIVTGLWEAPDWRDAGRRFFARDDEGRPLQTGTNAIPFTLALPVAALDGPVPIAMYQHGNPGSSEREVPSAARRSLAQAGFAVIGFTDVLNRELSAGIVDEQQAILAQTAPVLAGILEDHAVPDFWAETRGEMIAFLRFFDGLGTLDVLPVGAPDGVPDLDVTAERVYLGISEGGNNGQGFLPYAPEIRAGAIVAGGARLGEVLVHQVADIFLGFLGALFQSLDPTDIWVALSLFQTDYDRQDPHNHARFLYRDRLEVAGTLRKPSVLVLEGLDDTLVPNSATDSLAWSAGPLPHVLPVQRAVPFLEQVQAPIVGNIDAETTAAFYQYVPAGTPGIEVTPGCEFEPEGHYCAQTAPASLRQRAVFFQSALTGVPRIIDPLSDESGPEMPLMPHELLVR